MGQFAPFLIVLGVLVVLTALAARNRKRSVEADLARAAAIRVGAEVVTTSGLYGTVVQRNGDETVQLAIAPGVEVRWAIAALRDMHEMKERLPRVDRRPPDDAPH